MMLRIFYVTRLSHYLENERDRKHLTAVMNRHPSTSVCEIVVEASFESFEKWATEPPKRRGKEYTDVKEEISKKMLAVLFKQYPQLKDKIDFMDASTPLSSEHNLHSFKGSSYGLKCTPARFAACKDWLKPATALPGLYMAGTALVFKV